MIRQIMTGPQIFGGKAAYSYQLMCGCLELKIVVPSMCELMMVARDQLISPLLDQGQHLQLSNSCVSEQPSIKLISEM